MEKNKMNDVALSTKSFLESVEDILKDVLGVSELWIELTMDTLLTYGVGQKSLDLSSIDFVELIVKMENIYNITFEFDVTINSLQDLYDYIIRELECNSDDGSNKQTEE